MSVPGAESSVPELAWRALEGGASEELLRRNEDDWRQYRLLPRVFRSAGAAETRLRLFGVDLAAPIVAAPVHITELGRAGAIGATAAGVARAGSTLVLSGGAFARSAEVREHVPAYFQQIYLPEDRSRLLPHLAQLRDRGAAALFFTVDQLHTPYQHAFRRWVRELSPPEAEPAPPAATSVTLDDIGFLREASGLPVVVKGVLHPRDAVAAVDAGAAGVVVSNHGGRQIAGSVTSAQVLPEVVDALEGRVPVLVDSGLRTASDIAVALALGADAVLLGRPVVRAAWRGGSEAVATVIAELADELANIITLAGAGSLTDWDRQFIRPALR